MKYLKLYESFTEKMYHPLVEDRYDYENYQSPKWNYEKIDIKKLVKEFSDWKFYISPSDIRKGRYSLFIVTSDTKLDWLCWDKKERKKFIKVSNPEDYNISKILITGPNIKGYQVHDYEDEYFKCMVNDTWGNTEELYKCDTIDGLIQLLKDKKII